MNQVLASISAIAKPIHYIYVKAFDVNKYAAGIGFSTIITATLFFIMVILISLGDSGIKEDTSVKLAESSIGNPQKGIPDRESLFGYP